MAPTGEVDARGEVRSSETISGTITTIIIAVTYTIMAKTTVIGSIGIGVVVSAVELDKILRGISLGPMLNLTRMRSILGRTTTSTKIKITKLNKL